MKGKAVPGWSCAVAPCVFYIQAIALLCLLALCVGCGRQPKIRKLSESSVVLAFGDSLTAGTGANGPESYPAVLSKMLGCRVINAGAPGEDTTAGLSRLSGALAQAKPQLVILCHGGNDMLRNEPQDITISNLSAMIIMAKDAGADVILVGVPKPGLLLRAPPFYRNIAAKHNIPFNADAIAKILSTPALKCDQAHPNASGYRRLAESLAALINEQQP